MTAFRYLAGQRYGMVVLRECVGNGKWSAVCDCGKVTTLLPFHAKSGKQVSCGCWRKRVKANRAERDIWQGIKTRCYNPNCEAFPRYGGAGITMSPEWRDSFDAFLADMGPRPTNGHSVERKDNSLGYSPTNCVWGTRKDQATNRCTTKFLTAFGETKSVTEWSRDPRCAISLVQIFRRVASGMDPATAITTPARKPYAFRIHEIKPAAPCAGAQP